jgi:hypothetical protein
MTVYDSLQAGFILGNHTNMKQAAHHIMALLLMASSNQVHEVPTK